MSSKALVVNLSKLHQNTDHLIEKLKKFNRGLERVIEIAEIPDEIEHNLAELNKNLIIVNSVLTAVGMIPAISSQVKAISNTVKAVQKIVAKQKNMVQKVDDTYIEPIRDKLEELRNRMDVVIDKMTSFDAKLVTFTNAIKKKKIKLSNSVAADISIAIDKINGPLIKANRFLDNVEKKIDSIEEKCRVLTKTGEGIQEFMDKLDFMDKMLKPLNVVMNEKISVPYSFKVKVKVPKTKRVKDWKSFWKFVWKNVTVWEWEWQVKTENFTFTINQILKGVDNLMDEVMKLLEKEMNKVLEPVLGKVNLEIELPEIPGLDKVDDEIEKLRNLVKIDELDDIEDHIGDLYNGVTLLEKIMQ